MKSAIYRKNRRVRALLHLPDDRGYFEWSDKLLLDWQKDPRCPLTMAQLRRRSSEYMYGQCIMTPEEVITSPIHAPQPAKPRNRQGEKKRLNARLSKAQKWEKLCNQVATCTLMSPKPVDNVRIRKKLEKIRMFQYKVKMP